MAAIPQISNLEIVPSNIQSNGVVSYRDGNPIIQFIIGEQPRALVGRSVRFVGKFAVRNNTGEAADSYVLDSNADVTWMNNRLGIYNCIDRLVIKSQGTHQTIEDIKFYNRFCSSFIPVLNSLGDLTGHLSQTALIMPNYSAFKRTVLANPTQRGSGNAFACHLPCGLFNGSPSIPLMATKGLLVELHLAPDNSALFTGDGSVGIANSYYEMRDVRLVCEAVDSQTATSGSFEYNSVSSYYTSINSTNAVLNFNLGLSRVLGCFMNFLPAQNINNIKSDGMATAGLVGSSNSYGESASNDFPAFVKQAVFMKGAERFPLEYNLDLLQKDSPNNLSNTGSQNNEVDGSLQRNFMDSVQSFSTINRTLVSRHNTNYQTGIGTLSQAGCVGGADKNIVNGGGVHGVGIAYDSISDQGQNFSQDAWGVMLETGLSKDTPHSVFLFVHAKQTLAFNNGGVQVVS